MINNYKEFKEYLDKLDTKPRLLLHACCGPCTSGVLERLTPYFDVKIFYANDNIDLLEEFKLRQQELLKVAKHYGDVEVITKLYEPDRYFEAVIGHEHDGEFSPRCYNCMKMRMEDTAIFAKENGFDFFTTTLSISPYKSTKDINQIGYQLEEKYGIKYLYSDFKKEEGYKNSIKNSQELGLYRQDYCGCIYSKEEHELRNNKHENENCD